MTTVNRALSRPHQHPLRPQRHHGRPRHRLDPALRREPPGGLRQLHPGDPHRRAHGRPHCRSCTCTTATSSAAPSARCRCSTDEKVQEFIGPYRPINPMLDAKHPVTVGPFDGLHGWYFEHKVGPEPGHGPRPQGDPGRRRRVRRAHRPPVRPARPLPPDDAEIAIVVVGSTAGTTRMVVDKLRARGVKAGMVRVRAVPAVPARRVRQGARAREGGRRHGPRRLVRRPGRPRVPRGPRAPSTTATRVPRCCRSSTASAAATSSPTTSSRRSPCSSKAATSQEARHTERRYLNLRKD